SRGRASSRRRSISGITCAASVRRCEPAAQGDAVACCAAVAASPRIAVYLEQGPKRTFACALDWPGWCRVARGDDAALEMLAGYAPRYGKVAARAGSTLQVPRVADLEVVERVPGTLTTDFGAPDRPASLDS